MSFRLAIVSKVELWNFRNSSISVRFVDELHENPISVAIILLVTPKPIDRSTFLSPAGFTALSKHNRQRRLTDWHAFWIAVIGLSSVCLCEQLAECHVIHVLVRWRDNVGEGTWRVVELAEGHVVGLITCEGGGDVEGVVTPLVGWVAQVFHDDQVVELRVQLAVQKVEGKEEDREGQVWSRRGEATQGGALMDDYGDEVARLTPWTNEERDKMNRCTRVRALRSCSGDVHVARVVVSLVVHAVVGLTLGLQRLSVRVVLDLLHEFPDTTVIRLLRNRMWQSKYSEVDVNLVRHWALEICTTANNGFPRSIVFCFIFHIEVRAVTRKRVWYAPSWGQTISFPFFHVSQLLHEKNVLRIPENGMLLFKGKQRVSPFYHDLGLDFGWLDWNFWIIEQLLPLLSNNFWTQFFHPIKLQRISGGGRSDANTFS